MEATALSVGKSVLNGAIRYATSALAEEVALQLGVRRDQVFITNELEMMQAFLESAHDEGDGNRVVKVWVKQVRDVAYDVEDTLQEFAVRLEKQSWWRIRRNLLDRRCVAKQMKELRANVEDVSQRNMRYNLIKGSGSKAAMALEQSSISSTALFGIDEARHAVKQEISKVDLFQLINGKENDLRVIAVWGTSADLGQTSIIRTMYEDPDIKSKFSCRAWVRVIHPFNPKDFVQSLVQQFHAAVGVDALLKMEKTLQELAEEFNGHVNSKRYLIVLNDLSTVEEWDLIKRCFPDKTMGSRIIVSTGQVEVARLCAGRESIVSVLRCMSADQSIYAFHKKRINSEVLLKKNIIKKSFTRTRTMMTALEESHLVGREKEKDEIIKLISDQATQKYQVISVWGMGGLGKTTLVKDIYENQELSSTFEKRACVTVMRPFNLEGLLRSLIMQLDIESSDKKDVVGLMGKTRNTLLLMPPIALIKEMERLIEGKRLPNFLGMEHTSRIIVTTREENIAKVFKKTTDLNLQYPELVEQTEQILRKCGRLPLAIVTIGGFLSNQPKTSLERRKLNDNINSELEMNPELGTIRNVLMRSYDGLPYHLKSCFLYMPIFPEDYKVGRGRLAQGYSRDVHGKCAMEIADGYFMELISRSMILPSQQSIVGTNGIGSCQVHDLIREIGVSESMEENLVFTLEEGCSSNSQTTLRHLTISSNWKGDKNEFQSIVDMSRLWSITCFGMRLLRVLDLEDTYDLYDHHLKHIGKLLHLTYLSLRGCGYIFYLPDSLGNLRQLETLDVRGTRIVKLPKSIIKLQKLNYLRATTMPTEDGVLVPRGLRKLKALHTLGVVNIGTRGKVIIQDIKGLTLLHKLGVTGVNKEKGQKLCSTIVGLSRLESLSIRSEGEPGLCGCLEGKFSFPETLQSLKLYGNLLKLPEWIQGLKNLEKLKLRRESEFNASPGNQPQEHDDAIQVRGNLTNLAFLHLLKKSLEGEEVHLNFQQGMFGSLVVLELSMGLGSSLRSVKFEQGTTPKLEVLKFDRSASHVLRSSVLGLPSLASLKEVVLECVFYHMAHLRAELAKNPNRPVLKTV
ncbi:hypothetical protein VPH35_005858 [Triticum aestivum]